MLRLVLDTNCSVAGFLWSGAPTGILSLAERHRVELCACDATLAEFRRVIAYPRIQKQLERRFLSASVVGRDFERLHTFFPDPEDCPRDPPVVPDDPDDDLFYLLAEAATVDYLITRDDDLHRADDYAGIPSVDPGDFMRAYRRMEEGRRRSLEWGRSRWRIWGGEAH